MQFHCQLSIIILKKINIVSRKIQITTILLQIILTAFDFTISADRQYLLIAHDYQKVNNYLILIIYNQTFLLQLYRHSFRARYTIINLSTNSRTDLRADDTITGLDLFLVEWAPIGKCYVNYLNNKLIVNKYFY